MSYKYKDLEAHVQERLLQEHAQALDYEWWDCVESDYEEQGKERGFDIDDMYFSGFWSQGDGASWVGSIDIKKFLDYHLKPDNPQFTQFTILGELLDNDGSIDSRVKVTTDGRYSHQYTMDVEEMEVESYDDSDVLHAGLMAGANVGELIEAITPALSDFNTWMQDEARDYAGAYYKALEQEHEWLTGEESLIERDLDYDEEGEEIEEERGDAHLQLALFDEPASLRSQASGTALAGCPA